MTSPDARHDHDRPAERPTRSVKSDRDDAADQRAGAGDHAPLTTDPEAQVDDSVIEPGNT